MTTTKNKNTDPRCTKAIFEFTLQFINVWVEPTHSFESPAVHVKHLQVFVKAFSAL